jgi:hypothetical protein
MTPVVCHWTRVSEFYHYLFILIKGLAILPRLILKSWTQVVLLPHFFSEIYNYLHQVK